MKQINFFFHPAFGEIRTIKINSEHFFFAKDITVPLGYSNILYDLISSIHDNVVIEEVMNDRGDKEAVEVINIYCLISLINGSTHSEADQFRSWLRNEILPCHRKIDLEDVIMNKGIKIANDIIARHEANKLPSLRKIESEESPDIIMNKGIKIANGIIERHEASILPSPPKFGYINELEETSDVFMDSAIQTAIKIIERHRIDIQINKQCTLESNNDDSDQTYTTDQIAKELGVSTDDLIRTLCEKGFFQQNESEWELCAEHENKGYTTTKNR